MVWDFKSCGVGWVRAHEQLTTTQDSTSDISSSVIDFLPPDQDFLIVCTANNLSDSGAIELHVSATSAGTYTPLVESLITPVDNNTTVKFYDVSTYGLGAYNKLIFGPDGAQDADDTIDLYIFYKNYRLNAKSGS
jgi:hypothetical protein